MANLHIIWFKRDLRIHDHAAIDVALASAGPNDLVVPLYVFEPGLWALPESSGRHFDFLLDSLTSLDLALKSRGSRLIIRTGDIATVLTELHRKHGIASLHAHEETGLLWTYDRDRAVHAWCRRAGVRFIEHRQSGVIRGLRERSGWAKRWHEFMARPRISAPETLPDPVLETEPLPSPERLGLATDPCSGRQKGGRDEAVKCLNSFLTDRGAPYRRAMSNPNESPEACSRLSPHLAFGTLSAGGKGRKATPYRSRAPTICELNRQLHIAPPLALSLHPETRDRVSAGAPKPTQRL